MAAMSEEELTDLAHRIEVVCAGVPVDCMLASLGMVVVHAMQQFEPEERMSGCVGWIGTLCRTMTLNWNRSKIN